MTVKPDQPMGWTDRAGGVSFLGVPEEQRDQAGERLRQLRLAANWSQEDLAHAADLSVKTISRFENGHHDGRMGTLRALARALEVEETSIVGPPPPLPGEGMATLARIEAKIDLVLTRLGAGEELERLADELARRPLDDGRPRPDTDAAGGSVRRQAAGGT